MNPNYGRPATGTASANCHLGTRTEVSNIYRARTQSTSPRNGSLVPRLWFAITPD